MVSDWNAAHRQEVLYGLANSVPPHNWNVQHIPGPLRERLLQALPHERYEGCLQRGAPFVGHKASRMVRTHHLHDDATPSNVKLLHDNLAGDHCPRTVRSGGCVSDANVPGGYLLDITVRTSSHNRQETSLVGATH